MIRAFWMVALAVNLAALAWQVLAHGPLLLCGLLGASVAWCALCAFAPGLRK